MERLLVSCLGLVTPCFPVVFKGACEYGLDGGKEEEGLGWLVMFSASL